MTSLPFREVADRDVQAFRQGDQFGGRPRCANSAAGDDDRPLRRFQQGQRSPGFFLPRFGAERRHPGETRFAQGLHVGLLGVDLAFVPPELQVHRTGRAGGGGAERLADHVGKALHRVDGGVELRHRLESGEVVDLLVDAAKLGVRLAAPRHGDDRGVGEVGVPQAGGEVEGADDLGHADPRTAAGAGVAVGHVGGRFLRMDVQAPDAGAALQLDHGPPQHRGHHEQVGEAVPVQHVGHDLRAGHFRHSILSADLLPRPGNHCNSRFFIPFQARGFPGLSGGTRQCDRPDVAAACPQGTGAAVLGPLF